MKFDTRAKLLGLLTATALLWGASTGAYAAGTPSGTPVSNTATLNYSVGDVAQTPVSSEPVVFVVDNKVDLTVTSMGGRSVESGTDNQPLRFTLTNTGNTTQGYLLSAIAATDDTTDMESVRIYVDDGDGAFDVGGDTEYQTGSNVGDIAPDDTIDLWIVANTPDTASNNQTASLQPVGNHHERGHHDSLTGTNSNGETPTFEYSNGGSTYSPTP
ncbi:MAG: hypothetical protein ACREVE_13340, partial [Gammaproteobacteria bacterium]